MDNISQHHFMKYFSANLKTALEESDMTLNELSIDTGLSVATLSNYANGLQMPSLKAFINIMCAMGVEPEELVEFNRRVVK